MLSLRIVDDGFIILCVILFVEGFATLVSLEFFIFAAVNFVVLKFSFLDKLI